MPLFLREAIDTESAPLEVERRRSVCESLAGLRLRSRASDEEEGRRAEEDASLSFRCCAGVLSLKMWIVSVAEETQRRLEVALKDMLKIRDGIEPRRNWYSFRAEGIAKTRMMVPLSEAVARRVPVLLMVMQERGERCASTTFMASSFCASKISTAPLVGAM